MNKHLRNIARTLSLASVVVLCFLGSSAQVTHAAGLEDAVTGLTSKKFGDRVNAVADIAEASTSRSTVILEALVAGNLYYRKSDKRVVIGTKNGQSSSIIDAVSGGSLGETQTRTLKKVRANNKLRGLIKIALGASRLKHPDAEMRLAAATQMLRGPAAQMRTSVANALEVEADSDVRDTLEIVLAMTDARSDMPGEQIVAIERLGRSTRQEVRALLVTLAADDSDIEPRVRAAALDALNQVEGRLELFGYAQNLFFGLSLGSVLLLASVGLAITFGVMGVINMAHGEMVMLGAYTTFVVQQLMPNAIEYSLFVALPAAFIVAGAVGILIERSVIRFLYGRPLETLLATFGLSLILQQAVRSVFSPLNRSVTTPEWMSGSWALDPALSLTLNRVYIIVFALLVLGALALLLRRTRFGL
ncbi:MAG: urea transport system permease protein, partial [Gammaproteobacteria bacterium]